MVDFGPAGVHVTLLDQDGAPMPSTQGDERELTNLELTALVTGLVQTISAIHGPEATRMILAVAEAAASALTSEPPSTQEEDSDD